MRAVWIKSGESTVVHSVEKRQKVNRLLLVLLLATSHCTCDAASRKIFILVNIAAAVKKYIRTNILFPNHIGEGLKRMPKNLNSHWHGHFGDN